MAIRTKTLEQSTDKWNRRASVAGQDYMRGVQGSGQAWEAGARAGAKNYADGVTAAIGRGAFEKGVTAAGAGKFEMKTLDKGVRRFPEGVASSLSDYAAGLGPVLQAIQGTTLPPRRPSGDPGNIERVRIINDTLAKLKRR